MAKKMILIAIIALCLVMLLSSCGRSSGAHSGQPHWVHDQRLQSLMVELESDVLTHEPIEPPEPAAQSTPTDEYLISIPRSRVAILDEACGLAQELAASADHIAQVIERKDVPEADRAAFLAQVETLRQQAETLDTRAARRDREGVYNVYAEIGQTCNACHNRFRDFAGTLASR